MAIRIFPNYDREAVSASGLLGSIPVSLIKEVVTIKKISIINTISIIGVMFISLSSSSLFLLLNMIYFCAASETFEAPANLDWSITLTKKPASASLSETTTTEA